METYLKAKIQEIKITAANSFCPGSLTLDEDVMDLMGVQEYEQVYVNSRDKKGRIMTYLLKGKRGSMCCEVNGGAANHFKIGEIVHLLVFHTIPSNQYKPAIIFTVDN